MSARFEVVTASETAFTIGGVGHAYALELRLLSGELTRGAVAVSEGGGARLRVLDAAHIQFDPAAIGTHLARLRASSLTVLAELLEGDPATLAGQTFRVQTGSGTAPRD